MGVVPWRADAWATGGSRRGVLVTGVVFEAGPLPHAEVETSPKTGEAKASFFADYPL
jgi:hypothetical protein